MTSVRDLPPSEHTMRTVARVCDLLDTLGRHGDGLPLDRLAEAAGLPRSSAYRYLLTLERRGYVSRDRTSGLFRLRRASAGETPPGFWTRAGAELRPLVAAIRLRWVGVELTVGLLVARNSAVMTSEGCSGPPRRAGQCEAIDARGAHRSALGRAALVSLPVERMQAILDSVPNAAATLDHLTAVRLGGRAIERDESGGTRVSVPIPDLPLGAGLGLLIADARVAPEVIRAAPRLAQSCAAAICRAWHAGQSGE